MIGILLLAAVVLLAVMFSKTKTSYLMNNVAASSSKISFFVRTEQDKHVGSFLFLFFSLFFPDFASPSFHHLLLWNLEIFSSVCAG